MFLTKLSRSKFPNFIVIFFTVSLVLLVLGLSQFVWFGTRHTLLPLWSRSENGSLEKWKHYTLVEALENVAENGTVIVCAASEPYLPMLNNWLISVKRLQHHRKVLVIAEDYATLYKINRKWPGHAVLIPPSPDSHHAYNFGSRKFFGITSRRPLYLLQILELGYNVFFTDVDLVWMVDPFPYLVGNHDLYIVDDIDKVKPFNHSHDLPKSGKEGRTRICSGLIYMRPTIGAKLVMAKWIEEIVSHPWTKENQANDQRPLNWALMKSIGNVDMYLLPQVAFPSGDIYFKNTTWVQETKGKQVVIHNNYVIGVKNKIKRFRKFHLWLVDDYELESPLGKI
ncbi:UDP-D-xylose:L-fucose alpha-1,3-D-xylosyltransferase MGP4-like [Impatiens glandulifera]|uniref:UDP-D-xylose:L-fucose alpha-1,3-D-xylosyltransferase MGP4-like n=1 Tax=Impatiens glandulifera TaxID=253017 RepID=UPI001FB15965|nr:UDP-D-xylose:L-fucose alpha-1,3-D-xylosyltransferase MGP4-like [Impatiens glandulifera]